MEFRTIYFKGDILTKFLDVKGSFELPPIPMKALEVCWPGWYTDVGCLSVLDLS